MAMQDTSAHGNGHAQNTQSARFDGAGDELSDAIKSSAQGLSTELRRESKRLIRDASESASQLAAEKKGVAAEYLRAVAEATEAGCQVLEERGYGGTCKLVAHAVESLEDFTDNLATREPKELLDDTVTFARQNPAFFIGAALFAGFGLARLIQAGSDAAMDEEDEVDEYEDDDEDTTEEDAASDDAEANNAS